MHEHASLANMGYICISIYQCHQKHIGCKISTYIECHILGSFLRLLDARPLFPLLDFHLMAVISRRKRANVRDIPMREDLVENRGRPALTAEAETHVYATRLIREVGLGRCEDPQQKGRVSGPCDIVLFVSRMRRTHPTITTTNNVIFSNHRKNLERSLGSTRTKLIRACNVWTTHARREKEKTTDSYL